MAFRIERDEAVSAGLRRIVCDEIESAVAHLSSKQRVSRDKAIHESRKSIKKIRALLRLVSEQLGDTWTAENTRLRDIARRLSDFRDAFAMVATFDDLRKTYKAEVGTRLTSVRAGLARKKREAGSEEDVAFVLGEAASLLRKTARRVKTWPLRNDGYASIAPGLEATYRRGRKALLRARRNPLPETYHELRKRVKDHWYHIRLLENLWTGAMQAHEKSLKDLETWLGDDHNLAVLRNKITAEPSLFGREHDIELVLELIDKRQNELRDGSVSLAERIYEEKPRDFDRHVRHLWDTWRHEPKTVGT